MTNDTAVDHACPFCGAPSDQTTCTAKREGIQYGQQGKTISVILPVRSCNLCKQTWTDDAAEAIRDFAVNEQLEAERTPEQRAIAVFLSKERPRNNACGCMGRQRKDKRSRHTPGLSYENDTWREIVVHNLGRDKLKTIQQLRREFDLPLQQAVPILQSGSFRQNCQYVNEGSVKRLEDLGCDVDVLEHAPDLEPDCPCGMQWIVEVDNHYYRIHEIRSGNGVTHSAEDLGHTAGPIKLSR